MRPDEVRLRAEAHLIRRPAAGRSGVRIRVGEEDEGHHGTGGVGPDEDRPLHDPNGNDGSRHQRIQRISHRRLSEGEGTGYKLSTTKFTIPSRTIILQGWVSDVGCWMSDVCPSLFFSFHDGITFECFELEG